MIPAASREWPVLLFMPGAVDDIEHRLILVNRRNRWSTKTRMSEKHARVCAVITEESVDAAPAAINEAAMAADLVEHRLDYLLEFVYFDTNGLHALLDHKPLQVIITCRAESEGGNQPVADNIR